MGGPQTYTDPPAAVMMFALMLLGGTLALAAVTKVTCRFHSAPGRPPKAPMTWLSSLFDFLDVRPIGAAVEAGVGAGGGAGGGVGAGVVGCDGGFGELSTAGIVFSAIMPLRIGAGFATSGDASKDDFDSAVVLEVVLVVPSMEAESVTTEVRTTVVGSRGDAVCTDVATTVVV